MRITLLVLAAGMGSRYGGLKQIDPIGPNGEIILDYSVYDAVRAGFSKVVFVIRKEIEKDFRECVGKKIEKKIDVEYVFQGINDLPDGFTLPADRKKPWGTAHAILSAKNLLKEPFAVINADDFYGRSGYELLYKYLTEGAYYFRKQQLYFMVGYILRNTLSENGHVSRGVCEISDDDSLISVVERTKIFKEKESGYIKYCDEENNERRLSGDEIVSMNMWGFSPSIFDFLEEDFIFFLRDKINDLKAEFFISTVVSDLISSGRAVVKVLRSRDQWFGITYKEDKDIVISKIRDLIDKKIYPTTLYF